MTRDEASAMRGADAIGEIGSAVAAYGVDEFLFVYGDAPVSGARTDQLTVRSMIDDLARCTQW